MNEIKPIAWMFQHDETGRTMCVDAWQVENGFEENNPRLQKISPIYMPANKTETTGYQLCASGSSLNGYSLHIVSKKIYASEQDARNAIPEFSFNCCDTSFIECLEEETIKVTIVDRIIVPALSNQTDSSIVSAGQTQSR